MTDLVELVGPNQAVQIFGVKLVGVNADNGRKLLFTLAFILTVWVLGRLLKAINDRVLFRTGSRFAFWARQGVQVFLAIVLLLGVASIWFDDPSRLATGLGLVTAGLAFALRTVVTAFAGYLVILRGNNFNVGDRIVMGGVRGDVIGLTFFQTSIMEMGQPPGDAKGGEPDVWVHSRQYTGRIVSVTNDKIFSEPIFNFTRDFPFLWEEMRVPIRYGGDSKRAEQILLDVAERYTVKVSELSRDDLAEIKRRYFMQSGDVKPRVFYRLTDNWLELGLRFVVPERGIREIKDAMSRHILEAFEQDGIAIASATLEVVSLPPVELREGRCREPSGSTR